MLTDEQVDYLFQIKESKQKISDKTVRVMLKALRWTPEEIEHGVAFLKRPETEPKAESARAAAPAPNPLPLQEELKPKLHKPINIKQNPFPVGGPFAKVLKRAEEEKRKRHTLAGAVLGALVFLAGLLIYARLAGV